MSKRCPIVRSASLGEMGPYCSSIESGSSLGFGKKKASPKAPQKLPEKQPSQSIFTIESPHREQKYQTPSTTADVPYGVFCKTCHRCKKKFSSRSPLYMFGYLRAFCSLDCRNIQICIDDNISPASPTSSHKVAEGFLTKGFQKARPRLRTFKAVRD